jgi:hypothetical protein
MTVAMRRIGAANRNREQVAKVIAGRERAARA